MSDLEITATTNGPFHVRGAVQLRRKDGTVIADIETEAWLCRCATSRDKPFCDQSHESCGFRDAPTERWTGKTSDEAGGAVITVRRNGPYFVEGRAVVRNEDGFVLAEGSRIVLCRCGSSVGKPFCDASHRDSGFEAE